MSRRELLRLSEKLKYEYSYCVLMTNVNISIKKDAYDFLKSLKSDEKSFSDVILEFKKSKGSKENVMRFFGALADKDIDWKAKEERMKDFRDSFERRLGKVEKEG